MKILFIVGTRPEAIKMAPVIQQALLYPQQICPVVCNTAQHRQMIEPVLEIFHITPHYDLNIMQDKQSLTDITIAVLARLRPILEAEKPDWLLVQGDTTTAMAATVAAFYTRTNIGHVEAGLRTHNKYHPFPEEANRKIIDTLADLYFAPTESAANNLRAEGVAEQKIAITGNTVIDAVRTISHLDFQPAGTPLADLCLERQRLILVTAHRRENFGQGIIQICTGLRRIATTYPDVQLVYPVHLNPHIQEPVYRFLQDIPNITLLPPLSYLPFIWLLKQCVFVITDSGGLQEEAPTLGKPVLVLRETTERPEGVEEGCVRVIGTNPEVIFSEATLLLEHLHDLQQSAHNLYGDGRAAARILMKVLSYATPDEQSPG